MRSLMVNFLPVRSNIPQGNYYSVKRLAFILAVLFPLLCLSAARGSEEHPLSQADKPIFILNSHHYGNSWLDTEQAAIIDELRKEKLAGLATIEYMDSGSYPDGEHLRELEVLFLKKYGGKKFSLLIALHDSALDFAVKNHKKIFGDAPLVFSGQSNFKTSMLADDKRATGVVNSADPAGTIEVMLRLHPKTGEILILHDYTSAGLASRQKLEPLLAGFGSRVRFRFSDNLPVNDTYQVLETAPDDTLVLLLDYTTDREGKEFDAAEITGNFSRRSRVPIYSYASSARLGYGIVGGKLVNVRTTARETAKLAKRIVQGEAVEKVPIVVINAAQYMFDYRQLERFQIPLSALPLNSAVINRPVSFYDANRNIVLMAWTIIGFLLLVILALIFIIVQRRRLTLALQESKAKYYDLYENAPDMYYSIDVNGIITECNETFVQVTGYSKEEIIGRPIFDFYHEDSAEEARKAFRQLFTASGEIRNAERKVKRKDGSLIGVSLNVSAERDKEGRITSIRSIWRDVTERQRAEDKIRQQRAELSHVRRLVTIGEFATSIAHEINQPLTAILNNAQAAARFLSFDPPDLGELREALEDIIEDDKRAGAVVHHLRSFLKRQEFERKSLNINNIIEDVVTLLNCEVADKNVSLTLDLAADTQAVRGDFVELQQVLMNLILNACDAMTEADPQRRRLNIRSSADAEGNIAVAVRDSGTGLDSKALSRVFEPFFTTKPEGLGVGLSISKSIIEAHEGRLWAENNSGGGATFYFTLPVYREGHHDGAN